MPLSSSAKRRSASEPDSRRSGNDRRGALTGAFALALVAAGSLWVRWPGLIQGGIANHDVAGILYGGMLLEAGQLPYVDSIELKAPGTFYLARWLADGGVDIAAFQVWANLWGLASLVAVAGLAWRLWGPRAAVACAALYALHDAHLDTMDANYVTWAQLPMVLSAFGALEGLRHTHGRKVLGAFVVAGVLAGLAALLKRPAGVVAIPWVIVAALYPCTVSSDPQRREVAARLRALAAAVAGVALAHAPIVLQYLAAGELEALLRGYVLSDYGFSYAGFGMRKMAEGAASEGVFAAVYFLALPLALAAFAAWPPQDRRARKIAGLLGVWTALALLAASIGFRFYKGYFLAALPPLCLLAAAPWGLLGRARGMRRTAQVVALVPALVLAGRQALVLHAERVNRGRVHDRGGRIIARHVTANSPPGSRVWVWGWHLWDVYPMTGMLSGSRIYKSDSLITTGNDSTWRHPRSPLHFVDGPMAGLLLEDLQRTRPHYIVLGSTVPHREFTALRDFLRREYELDRRVRLGRVQFWRVRGG